MYDIIPLILILISLAVIIAIIIRKFPVLANLNTESMPAEKEAKFKEQIISKRIKRNIIKWTARLTRTIKPAGQMVIKYFKWLYNKLIELKERYKKEEEALNVNSEDKLNQLFQELDEIKKEENEEAIEKKLIEIISLDNKNIKAFRQLGDLYFKSNKFQEAIQTFEHIIKLTEDNNILNESVKASSILSQRADTYFNLALVYKEIKNMDKSIHNIKNALNIEPNNPRYLDIMLEISIINKEKVLALDAYNKLLEANPDNQKLAEFKKQIKEI